MGTLYHYPLKELNDQGWWGFRDHLVFCVPSMIRVSVREALPHCLVRSGLCTSTYSLSSGPGSLLWCLSFMQTFSSLSSVQVGTTVHIPSRNCHHCTMACCKEETHAAHVMQRTAHPIPSTMLGTGEGLWAPSFPQVVMTHWLFLGSCILEQHHRMLGQIE
jgi:hypothetical protein